MKKIKYYIIISLIFFIASCQKDNEIEFYDLGSEFFIHGGDYTSLDDETLIWVINQPANLSAVNVTNMGNIDADGNPIIPASPYTGTISIVGDSGAINLSDVNLGMTEIGWTAKLQFSATYDGKTFLRYLTVEVADPVSISAPKGNVIESDTVVEFGWDIAPALASVETVTVQTKVSVLGDYVDLPGPFEASDSFEINGADYNLGDTLFVNVIGTNGDKSASTETEIVVVEPD
jgi:hypothetical protein